MQGWDRMKTRLQGKDTKAGITSRNMETRRLQFGRNTHRQIGQACEPLVN